MYTDLNQAPEAARELLKENVAQRLREEILSAVRQLRRREWPAPSERSGVQYFPRHRSGFVEGVLFWIAAALVAGRFIDRWHWRRRERALARKEQLLRDLGLAA